MSTAAVSTSSIYQESQAFFQQRASDLQQLGQALQSGDLTAAKQQLSAIQALGQGGPFANGDAFKVNQRQFDFQAIGQALQAGDLRGAQQAFAQLKNSFQHQRSVDPPAVVVNLSGSPTGSSSSGTSGSTSSQSTGASSTGAASGTEIVLNLGNVTPGEQITIGVSNAGNGAEQVTIGVGNQQNQSPEQITLNLSQNSNQQIILNLFNSTDASGGTSSTTPGSGVSVTA